MLPVSDDYRKLCEDQAAEIARLTALVNGGPSWLSKIGDAFAYLWSTHKTDIVLALVMLLSKGHDRYFPAAPQVDPVVLQSMIDDAVKLRAP